jgi:hypothetical protein
MPEFLKPVEPFLPFAGVIFITALSAFLGAWLGAKFELGRYRAERWWAHRKKGYDAILELLHETKRNLMRCSVEGPAKVSGSVEAHNELADSFAKIWKVTDMASYLLSDEAAKIMDEYTAELTGAIVENPFAGPAIDHAQYAKTRMKLFSITDTCLSRMKELSRRDLRVK